jgi:hypothetical protein
LNAVKQGLAVLVAIGLAACNGQLTQIAPSSSSAQSARSGPSGRSWMSPQAKKQALLYVSSVLTGDVYAYSYSTQQLMGTLTGFEQPYGLCTDRKGDVWIANDGASELVEYAHGGTSPIATLSEPGEYPEGCSVDTTTGDLAVTNFSSTEGNGDVAIYAKAQGTPKTYTDSEIANYRFCGYDPLGNLYIDGATSSGAFVFAALSKGGTQFANISLSQKIEWPGGVQWDGKWVDVGDTDAGVIYQTNGEGGAIEGSVTLSGVDYVNQFWIVGAKASKTVKNAKVVAPSQDGGNVAIFKYPAGGDAQTKFSVEEPFGAAVSP